LTVKRRARFRQYDRERGNAVISDRAFDLADEQAQCEVGASTWLVRNAGHGHIEFRCVAGALPDASVAVEFVVCDWSPGAYLIVPGAVYRGNRFVSRRIPYSPKLFFPQDIGPDRPPVIADIPRLNIGAGVSRIQMRSGAAARPAVGFRAGGDADGNACWLLTSQGNEWGDFGLDIEENRARTSLSISIVSPVVRELSSYRICDNAYPSEDTPVCYSAGDAVIVPARLHVFTAASLDDLFARYIGIRRELLPEPAQTPLFPWSACFELLEDKFNRFNFVPEHGYYAVGPRTNFLQDWQIGWTGGMISTWPLLFAGSASTRERVVRNFDWLFAGGIAPSGFFYDACENGTRWIGGDIRKPHTGNWHLIRKSGDAVLFILRHFALMSRLGIVIRPIWSEGLLRVCDALTELWNREGQFGQFVDSVTGRIAVGGSASGAIVPAALLAAVKFFDRSDYRTVALAAADRFYRDFTEEGFSCGGPGDALQCPDSESAWALVESFTAVYENTGEPVWLRRACEAARQFATWVVSYDYSFPPSSTFAQAGIESCGAVYANAQNQHAAPGICTGSGQALFRLYRATGDRFFADLLREIAFGLPQYLPHPLHPLGAAEFGHMCERVNLTDWEGADRIGETLRMTTWAETALMLTAVEIPGVYLETDTRAAIAFDHVKVEPEARGWRFTNPTPAQARVRVYAEGREMRGRPLPPDFLYDAPVVTLAPGESRVLDL
jgi:hypothetical protein